MSGITTRTSADLLPTASTSKLTSYVKEDFKWKKIPKILCCKTNIKTVVTVQQTVTLINYDIGIDFETCSVS